MIHYEVYFDKYRWSVEVFIILSHADPKVILDAVKRAGGSSKVLESAHANLMEDFNSGFTYSSSKYRRSIMVVNRSSSMEEFINTYNHEKNHVEMHICEELGIDPYSEEAAYLSGNMAQQLFLPAVCSFLI